MKIRFTKKRKDAGHKLDNFGSICFYYVPTFITLAVY